MFAALNRLVTINKVSLLLFNCRKHFFKGKQTYFASIIKGLYSKILKLKVFYLFLCTKFIFSWFNAVENNILNTGFGLWIFFKQKLTWIYFPFIISYRFYSVYFEICSLIVLGAKYPLYSLFFLLPGLNNKPIL